MLSVFIAWCFTVLCIVCPGYNDYYSKSHHSFIPLFSYSQGFAPGTPSVVTCVWLCPLPLGIFVSYQIGLFVMDPLEFHILTSLHTYKRKTTNTKHIEILELWVCKLNIEFLLLKATDTTLTKLLEKVYKLGMKNKLLKGEV